MERVDLHMFRFPIMQFGDFPVVTETFLFKSASRRRRGALFEDDGKAVESLTVCITWALLHRRAYSKVSYSPELQPGTLSKRGQ